MKIAAKTRPAAGAFTLAEVLVGVAVIGVLMLALFAGFRQSFQVVVANRENLRATQLLQEKMELIRLYNWTQVTNSGYVPTTFSEAFDPSATASTNTNYNGVTYYGTVVLTNMPTAETYATNMRMVSITLNWTNGQAHTRNMTTFISRYGLQNYIY